MPGLTHRNSHSGNSSSSALGSIGRKARSSSPQHGIDPSQLHKFWDDLSLPSRRDLLRIDKHTLFEQVRKNMYCSRCNGLLLEGFSQIIVHGKNLQGGSSYYARGNAGDNREASDMRENMAASDARDPSVHPWGGLTATRDSMLTLLECFFNGQSLEVLQNVFDCARTREWERELLYPDACGGGGRGWISQGNGSTSFSRGYSLKETCALHTARLSCDALVDFWSALGDETRRSLLRMKEEDFIARLMYRFDSKRFCRDCRRNVLREFKELKELKRTRKEPRCTRWFCTADTAFRYEVTNSSVLVNWRECFEGDVGNIYQHFEWALGSAEGTSDILEFEDVGFSEGARVDGLDLSHVSAFYITLRAWKHDGRCTEISVKAHALKGQQCVHRRLIVGDGYVAITKGESIKRFFEHAEEAEEEEDDDGMDKDGSETESEGSRFQKHAKSPELAREFLLDAATVIFKEQVEKAFREGTARQNAHTTFVCLALSLLEERIYVACKEISTLEKQNKLLEEEEHEKREEEQRRERKRLKEKEKKMRRKEKLKGKQKDKEKVHEDTDLSCNPVSECNNGAVNFLGEHDSLEAKETCINDATSADSAAQLSSTDRMVAESSCETTDFNGRELLHCGPSVQMDGCDDGSIHDNDGAFIAEQTKEARKRSKIRTGPIIETVSRRLVRRRAVMALESGVSARGFFKLTYEPPPREMAEKAIPKHNKVSSNHDRNTHSSWPERWNPRQFKKQSPQEHVSPCSRNSSCVTGKHNDGKDSVMFKRPERKAAVAVGYKQVYGAGKSNPGTVQFNWQVIKSRVSVSHNGVKRGDQSPDKEVLTESPSSKQCCLPAAAVSSSHDHVKPPLAGLKRDHSTTLGSDLTDSSLVEHQACNSECSGTFSTAEDLNNELEPSRCDTEASDSSESPPAELEVFTLEKPLRRLAAGCLTETIDEDSSPSSGASCVTDTSDGLTSDSMITEGSCLEGGFTSQSTLRSEFSAFVPNELQEPCYNVDGFTHNTNVLSGQAGEYYAFATGGFPHPDLYSYSCTSSVLAYSNGLPCGYMHNPVEANPEGAVMTVEQQICQVDTSMQLPVITGPVLPAYQAEHYGYPWIQGPCEAVPHPDLLPLSHPSSLVLHNSPAGFSSSHGGLSSTYLSMPPQFQPMHQVLNFSCLPVFTPEATPMQWREDRLVFGNQQEVASGHDSRYDCYQDESCDKEQMSTTTNLLDAKVNDGFSFFHFGALPRSEVDPKDSSEILNEKASSENLRIMKTSCRSKLQEGIPKLEIPVDEYSLFAATPRKRFSFF